MDWVLRLDHARWFRDELARIEASDKPEYIKVQDRGQLFRGVEARTLQCLRDLDPQHRYVATVLNRADVSGVRDIEFVVTLLGKEPVAVYTTVLAEIYMQEAEAVAA